jgi:DNA polymerase III subunit gamma/tau
MAKQKPAPAEKEGPARPVAGAANQADSAAGDYTVLARRYRPQTFADLVGQEPVARALANALKMGRVAHAYLFTGARGVGKTSTARILAKALNCVHGPTPEPCGVCEICQSIATGEDVDVLEIDGASNRRIDEVRDIRSNVQYRPGRARYKIYIIDEVHMLTKEAFNALLKTLEEPPPHVKFIFATTEVEKVPVTILSRCQRFDFAGIPLPRIVERLHAIAEREKVQADPDALERIARRAGGSMRDAQSLLDQLLAFGGERLTADGVHHLLGTAGDERVVALADAVLARDPKKALDLLDEALTGGLQHGELVDQLIAYWRDLMVLSCGGGQGGDLSVPARHHETLRGHAAAISLEAILAGLDVLSATKARLRGSHHGRTLVEMALVRLSRLHDLVSLSQLAQWVGQVRADPRGLAPGAGGTAARAVPPEGVKKKSLNVAEGSGPEQPAGPVELNDVSLPRVWDQALGMVGAMLGSELTKAGLPAISGPNTLVLRFPVAYTKARAYCQAPERLARVEDAVGKLTGRPWKVRVETSDPAAPDSTGGEAGGIQGPTEGAPARPRSNSREEAEKLPLIKRAIDVLGATIHRVDEGFGSASTERTQRPAAPPEEG